MRRLLNVLFALALVFGTSGAGLRVERSIEACGCCENMLPAEPCGCGMPQQSSSQRCGGSQAPSSTALARPTEAPVAVHCAEQAAPREALPCPEYRVAQRSWRDPERAEGRAFTSGEGPPLTNRQAHLSLFRI